MAAFTLKSEYKVTRKGITEKNIYESLLTIKTLKESIQHASDYDKDLKIHFEKPASVTTTYEIDQYRICLSLCSRLEKASEFTRLLMLRYDYIQPKINHKGKIVGIENVDEILGSWPALKDHILIEHEGSSVTNYLELIEQRMKNQDFQVSPLSQYFFFGLIFPGIPVSHPAEWNNTRIVEFSDYEDESFVETITYDRNIDNLRLYHISGKTKPESGITINNFTGLLRVNTGELLPVRSDVSISYEIYDSVCEWVFELMRYN